MATKPKEGDDNLAAAEADLPDEVAKAAQAQARRAANARHKKIAEFVNEYTAQGGDINAPVISFINWSYEQTIV
ncbi:MAG: hypothetical protein ACR2PR_06315 [Pseudohongiellaceae bacterium]